MYREKQDRTLNLNLKTCFEFLFFLTKNDHVVLSGSHALPVFFNFLNLFLSLKFLFACCKHVVLQLPFTPNPLLPVHYCGEKRDIVFVLWKC